MYKAPKDYKKEINQKIDKTLGYEYFIDKDHPLCSKQGKVLYHRHIASVSLGKWIYKDYDVHHIDHNRSNNDPSNLEIITRRMHNRKHAIEKGYKLKLPKTCPGCSKRYIPKCAKQKTCSIHCAKIVSKYSPLYGVLEKEILRKLLWEIPTTKIALKYNCSDKAIGNWAKKWNLSKPPRGYWAKQKSLANSSRVTKLDNILGRNT